MNGKIHPTPTVQAIAWGLVEWGDVPLADRRKLWACIQRELRKNNIFIRRVEHGFKPWARQPVQRYELWGEMRYYKGRQHWHRLLSPAGTMKYACEIASWQLKNGVQHEAVA